MAIKLKAATRTIAEEGSCTGRLCGIIDLGVQRREWQGAVKDSQQKLLFSFELPTEMIKNKDGDDEPRRMSKGYNVSFTKKSSLPPLIKALDPTGTLKGNDAIENLLGAPCMLSIEHYTKDGEPAAKIASVTQIMKGLEVPELFAEPTSFSLEDPDMEQWDGFADWIKEKIREAEDFSQSPLAELDVKKDKGEDVPF